MKRFSMPQFLAVCFITIIINMNINSYMQIRALDNIANLISESKQQQQQQQEQQVIYSMAYEEPEEEIVPVYFDDEEYNYNGNMIYTFGDISDEFYFFIFINEEQGIYEYYYPAMHVDWPIECDSLAELQCVIDCHIEQAYPNATFVMR